MWCGMAAPGNHVDGTIGRVSNPPLSSPRLLSRPLSPVPSQLSTRARGTNDEPTHLAIPPTAVRIIPFHYIIVITDGTVGAGFKPARIIAAPVATRTIAAYAIGSLDDGHSIESRTASQDQ